MKPSKRNKTKRNKTKRNKNKRIGGLFKYFRYPFSRGKQAENAAEAENAHKNAAEAEAEAEKLKNTDEIYNLFKLASNQWYRETIFRKKTQFLKLIPEIVKYKNKNKDMKIRSFNTNNVSITMYKSPQVTSLDLYILLKICNDTRDIYTVCKNSEKPLFDLLKKLISDPDFDEEIFNIDIDVYPEAKGIAIGGSYTPSNVNILKNLYHRLYFKETDRVLDFFAILDKQRNQMQFDRYNEMKRVSNKLSDNSHEPMNLYDWLKLASKSFFFDINPDLSKTILNLYETLDYYNCDMDGILRQIETQNSRRKLCVKIAYPIDYMQLSNSEKLSILIKERKQKVRKQKERKQKVNASLVTISKHPYIDDYQWKEIQIDDDQLNENQIDDQWNENQIDYQWKENKKRTNEL